MTSCNRLDPLAFAGSFAYLESDLPPGVALSDWRSLRTRSAGATAPPRRADADAGLAPEDRTPLGGADEAHRPRNGRGPSPRRDQ